jgi:hypothetical protein
VLVQGQQAENEREEGVKGIPFSFSFLKFSSHFSKDFEFSFVFSNRAHNTKYYATT